MHLFLPLSHKTPQPPVMSHSYVVAEKRIVAVPQLLSADECAYFRALIDAKFPDGKDVQTVIEDGDVAQRTAALLQPRLPREVLDGLGWSDYVAYTRRTYTVSKHRDRMHSKRERYKLLIYLNTMAEGTGGTVFFESYAAKTPSVRFANREGDAILFDMDLYHQGVPHRHTERKYLIGFRFKATTGDES